ncbi:GNAT family N-acetyltransferase [Actinacidiphila yeochonensis]|uniref:GNAT family N-acetyltransferase n=1 Tax=Actinacidiphila yeochonensis TaxID=89050 RepID=UPI00099B36F8|nr:GNAT family N-acetyltransferase [Actinacidiphila yeochonensis]
MPPGPRPSEPAASPATTAAAAPATAARADRARVRPATPADLPRIAELAAEHAAFEQAAPPAPDLAERLSALLCRPSGDAPDGGRPRVRLLVAESPSGEVVGYASCAPEFSTWEGRDYLHLDCLYLCADHRGRGVGELLMREVAAEARRLGLRQVQWQTPEWNEGAIRFYDRIGATGRPKLRYTLPVPG